MIANAPTVALTTLHSLSTGRRATLWSANARLLARRLPPGCTSAVRWRTRILEPRGQISLRFKSAYHRACWQPGPSVCEYGLRRVGYPVVGRVRHRRSHKESGECLLLQAVKFAFGSISRIQRMGPNDRDVRTADLRASALSAPFVAIADVRVLQSHRSQRVGN